MLLRLQVQWSVVVVDRRQHGSTRDRLDDAATEAFPRPMRHLLMLTLSSMWSPGVKRHRCAEIQESQFH